VTLSNGDVVIGKQAQLIGAFEEVFMDYPGDDAALFSAEDSITTEFLFSPGASRIAMAVIEQYSGTPCPAPRLSEVSLMVGNQDLSVIPFAPEL
jgi:hypothetical protein